MAYTPQNWSNLPATTTPLSAARLLHMETGIDEAHTLAEDVPLDNLDDLPADTVIGNPTGSAGTPQAVSMTPNPTASAVARRDANGSLAVNAVDESVQTVTSAGGLTTLTVASPSLTQITGTTTQTVVLPNAVTLRIGWKRRISNRSTGIVTVNMNGGSLLLSMAAGTQAEVTVTNISTAAGAWDAAYSSPTTGGTGGGSGDGVTVVDNNDGTIDVSGTAIATISQASLDLKIDKALVDAKGDLLVGTANNIVGRLAVSPVTGHVFMAAPTQTEGVQWAAIDDLVKAVILNHLVDSTGAAFQVNGAGKLVIPVTSPPSPPSGPIAGSTASLQDDFTGANSAVWIYGIGASVNAGLLSLIADVDGSKTESVTSFNLTGSTAYCELVQAANGGATGGNTIFQLVTDATHTSRIVFLISAGVLEFERVIGGVFTTSSIAYDPVQHRFLRFREGADVIAFDTAPDNVTWTERWTTPRSTLDVTALFYSFEAWSNSGVVSSALFDNVNKFTAQPNPPGGGGDEAATVFGWGTPDWTDNFDYASVAAMGAVWGIYNGPGHAGNGTRSPNAWSLSGGIVTCTGYGSASGIHPAGESGGMGWRGTGWRSGVKYGRWECRARTAAGSVNFHPVLLLWADSAAWPTGGEMDFLEIFNSASRQFVEGWNHRHNGSGGLISLQSTINKDATQWHNWAVEWRSTHAKYYCDGVEWGHFAASANTWPDSMHLCVQLDNFVTRGPLTPPAQSTMQVDWAKHYPAPA